MYVYKEMPQCKEGWKGKKQVIQRQIYNDSLNVIGENHLEDRKKELAYLYSWDVIKEGQYWIETTFPKRVGTYGVEGDPAHLRFRFLIAAIFEKAEEVKALIDGKQKVVKCSFDYLNGALNVDRIKRQMEDENCSLHKYIAFFGQVAQNEILRKLHLLKAELEAYQAEEWSYNSDAEKYKDSISTHIEKVITVCETIKGLAYTKSSKKEYMQTRSIAMHFAANQYSNMRGVWKIGDNHREQMETIQEKDYNLVSKAEFENIIKRNERPQSKNGSSTQIKNGSSTRQGTFFSNVGNGILGGNKKSGPSMSRISKVQDTF